MTSFTLEQLQRVADTYAQFLRVRHVQVVIANKLPANNPLASALSDSLRYRSYVRNMRRAKVTHKFIAPKEYRRLFPKRQRILVHPRTLFLSRGSQIAIIIHELHHFTVTPFHGKKFWNRVRTWYNPKHTSRKTLKAEAKANGFRQQLISLVGERK